MPEVWATPYGNVESAGRRIIRRNESSGHRAIFHGPTFETGSKRGGIPKTHSVRTEFLRLVRGRGRRVVREPHPRRRPGAEAQG